MSRRDRLRLDALARAVTTIAARLGEQAGHCAVCGRPVRLMSHCGLVPGHYPVGRPGAGAYCPGGEQPPRSRS